jgi:hypothetical protein
MEVLAGLLGRIEKESGLLCLKAILFDSYSIMSDRKTGKGKVAGVVGDCASHYLSIQIRLSDLSSDDDGARRVGDQPGE